MLNNNIKISFIIPVYNVEKYLKECIDSILYQKIDCKEIILINDGSTDKSGQICDYYNDKYDFIKVIHKKNQGVSIARNVGIDIAKGEYIFFMDSDDFILDNCIQTIYDECIKNDLDIIRCFYCRYDNNTKKLNPIIIENLDYYNMVLNGLEFLKKEIVNNKYEIIPCLGLFRRKYLLENNLKFSEKVTYEDHEFFLKCLLCKKNNKIMRKDMLIYSYRITPGSITHVAKIKNIKDILKNINLMINFIDSLSLTKNEKKLAMKTVSTLFYQLTSVYGRLSEEDKKKAYKIVPKKLKNSMIKNSFDSYQKNKIIMFFYFRKFVDLVYKFKLAK